MKLSPKDRLLIAGKYYFNIGFEVFPGWLRKIYKDGKFIKMPILPEWKKQTFSYELFKSHLITNNYNAICIKTGFASDLFVLDLDVKTNKSGMEYLNKLGIYVPDDTPCIQTQSGGFHYYFKFHHSLYNYSTGSDRLYAIDWRGNGGIVFAPPTQFSDRKYKFIQRISKDKSNLRFPPKKLIKWILSHDQNKDVIATEYGKNSINDLSEKQRIYLTNLIQKSANTKMGKRSEIDFSTIKFAVKIGMAKGEIYKLVKDIGKFKNRPDYFDYTFHNALVSVKNRKKKNAQV